MPKRLFVYGTLHPDRAPAELAEDVRRFVPIGYGSIRGELHTVGGYPAVPVSRRTKNRVEGTVYEIPGDPALLARLDRYEDFRPNDSESSLYLRKRVQVRMDDGTRRLCWVYLYPWPING